MSSIFEDKFGELALARELISFQDLLRCIRLKSSSGRSLEEVVVDEGYISQSSVDELNAELTNSETSELVAEFENNETLVNSEVDIPPKKTIQRPIETGPTLALDAPAAQSKKDGGAEIDETPDTDPEPDGPEDLLEIGDLGDVPSRYEMKSELGRGGMGEVLLTRDKVMMRDIALKTVLPDLPSDNNPRERLVHEARLTGSLEHPNVVPTYEIGQLPNGEPYYTMRVVREKSLEQILEEKRTGDGGDEHSLTQLVSILRQVALALQYAHDQNVVHRDIKPENILIGSYGEVFIIDWGVAKVVDDSLTSFSTEELFELEEGAILGTPYYMAPEQARGENTTIDHRADVYALGSVLYDILTLTPVFQTERTLSLLLQVVQEEPDPPSKRAPDREVPAELEEICLTALEKDPDDRYQTAEEFADELEMFLEGVKERERRLRMAKEATQRGHAAREKYHETKERHARVVERLHRTQLETRAWAPTEEKEDLWQLQQQAEDLQVEVERTFGEATRIYGQALGHVPEMDEARRALADLYWERFEDAESEGDRGTATYFQGLVRQFNDGQYDDLLEGMATLGLETHPSAAPATLFRYAEVNRRLVERHVTGPEESPVAAKEIEHGSYVFEIEKEGFAPVESPVALDRLEERILSVNLYPREAVPEDFVIVPSGPFISESSLEDEAGENVVELPDFAIMRHPVTCREYLEFLNGLAKTDLERARQHNPRLPDSPPYFPLEDGAFRLPEEDQDGDSWDPDWPICLVNCQDAQAYAKWRSQRDGFTVRLPTVFEWEKAARGVDGRSYPWGNHFDAAFCNMAETERGRSMPAPVGSHPIDRSPYGAMDMAGNVFEWTSTPPSEDDPDRRILQGAAYRSIPLMCRLDWHLDGDKGDRRPYFGFRLVLPLSDSPPAGTHDAP